MEPSNNILVTGGSGFLGSHICETLTEAGHRVTVFDKTQSEYLIEGQKMVLGDVGDFELLNEVTKGIDYIFHLAAVADIDFSSNHPVETMQDNIMGTTYVLEAARKNGVKRIILASTIYVHSNTGSFYRVSKHACELLLEAYHERYDLEYTVLRFGTLYGTRANEQNSVYRILKEALTSDAIRFSGTGTEVREYIHVRDAAHICQKIISPEFSGETLILTGHHRMKLSELLDMINEILGGKIEIDYDPEHTQSHYIQTPYSYIPRVGKKIVMNTYSDFGQSLVEILDEINGKTLKTEIEV